MTTNTSNNSSVFLKCIKEGSRLRVRIITPGYYNDANCQFPRKIRFDGRKYKCSSEDVKLAKGPRGKYFYRINTKNIQILDHIDEKINIKVYGDDDSSECIVCMDANKDVVFAPCGHYCSCSKCANNIYNSYNQKCPMCRASIIMLVERNNIG